VDDCKPLLHGIFMNYAAAEVNNNRKSLMSLQEFSLLCTDAQMWCDTFERKHAAAIYTHSQLNIVGGGTECSCGIKPSTLNPKPWVLPSIHML